MAPSPIFILATIVLGLPQQATSGTAIRVVDDLGRPVSLQAPARRIISLAPSITESLFAIGAGDQVAGVTDYCDFPPAARSKKHIGGMTTPSIEAIVGLDPDLIVLSMEGNLREDFAKLESLGIPLFVTNPRTLEGIHRSLRNLGVLTGRQEEARALIASMTTREDSLRPSPGMPRLRVLLFVSLRPLIAAGKQTFINELLTRAGALNLAADVQGTYPTLSREAVVAADPDFIIVTADAAPDPGALITLFPEWKMLRAIQNRRVLSVDPDLISRPGPRAVDGLYALFHILHPNPQ